MTGRELHWNISGQSIVARLEGSGDHGTFHVGGKTIAFRLLDRSPQTVTLDINGRRRTFHIVRNRNQFSVWHEGHTYHFSRVNKSGLELASGTSVANGDITALMPGKVLRVEVSIGDIVEEKQAIATMESMKMETVLKAPRSGRISQIYCQSGQVVDMGQLLIRIE